MPTLIHTVGAANANSFLSLEDAETRIDHLLHADAWAAADEDDQIRALVIATAALCRVQYRADRVGYETTRAQALRFPAYRVARRSGVGYYPSDAIPEFILEATALGALGQLQSDRLTEPSRDRSVKRQAVGSLSIEYFAGDDGQRPKDALIVPAWEVIAWWAVDSPLGYEPGISAGDVVRAH